MMNNQKNTGIKRIFLAFKNSLRGLKQTWQSEAAFRQEAFLAVLLIPLAFWFNVTNAERALMIVVVILVLIVEILNSAIESVVDRISLEHHPLSGQAKDMGSAAVTLALILVALVWGIILL